ncbi:hypothetical protein [Bradyrhizobium sp.]|uniref:hypothetical protein n=1 Tax=Bradyrhizobium sp. TaxID=376 RepID=UPI00272A9DA6|nr:hypothetical protein [Bradyrhizobium sp.]
MLIRNDQISLTRCCDSPFRSFPVHGKFKNRFERNPDSLWSHPVHAGFVRHARKQRIEAAMNAEFDYDLTRDQWEALKALRLPAAERRIKDRLTASLIALKLAAMAGDGPVITAKGRSVLLRGSPQLWDVAA